MLCSRSELASRYPKGTAFGFVHVGHDNALKMLLLEGNEPQPLDSVERMVLSVGGETVDSDLAASAFDWTQLDSNGYHKLILKLGPHRPADIEDACELLVYEPSNPNGIVWISSKLDEGPNLVICTSD